MLLSSPTLRAGDAAAALPTVKADLLIVGGTESGWAAAIQAARMGVERIVIVHDGQWLGGQYTEQALACVDENKGVGRVGWGVAWHPMKRSFHRSGLFKELMDRIEAHNKRKYGAAMPGRPFHGPSTFRPVEAERLFRQMLQPYVDRGQVRVFWNYYPIAARTTSHTRPGESAQRPRLEAVRFQSLAGNEDLEVEARWTIDASDWGEVIQVAGAAFECGPDPKSRYGEPDAPEDLADYPPNEMNPITWAMIVAQSDGETPIDRPAHYDDRNYARTTRLSLEAMRDLPWDRPARLGSIPAWPVAGKENASPRQLTVYNVRRLVDGYQSKTGQTIILLNYMLGQDYPLERLPRRVVEALEATEPGASRKNIVTMTRPQRRIIFDDAKQHALGVLYHLQNFVHQRAEDTTHSFRRFHLSEEFGTPDRLPPKPYIRESLRLKAMYMMREQDGRNTDGPTKQYAREALARVMYHDGVLAWQFHYDFHRTGRAYLKDVGDNGPWIDFEKPGRNTHIVSDRAVFPLRSLIPERMDGLLGAQKNLGYSSLVSAAIRLHDQCVHIGQAAGATAAICLREDVGAREIPYDRRRLEQVREALCGGTAGAVPLLLWPFRDLPAEHPAFVAVNRLAARFALPLDRRDVDFRPEEPAGDEWRRQVVEMSLETKQSEAAPEPPQGPMSRGEFARRWWEKIARLPDKPFTRLAPDDADRDGIADTDDPLPLDSRPSTWPEIDRPLPPDEDGRPDAVDPEGSNGRDVRGINFAPDGTPPVKLFQSDHGAAFDSDRGFGWSRDKRNDHRRRASAREPLSGTFVFTRDEDVWEMHVPNGRWRVTVCIGDAEFEQPGQNVAVEGKTVFEDRATAAGRHAERTVEVEVRDGRLTMRIGRPGASTNTCVNWLRASRSDGPRD